MADGSTLGKAYVQIIPSAKGISGAIQGLINNDCIGAGEKGGAGFASKFASVAKGVLAGGAIAKVVSDSLNEGAKLQQSLGGIETLFKGSADKVKNFASEAFKTVGVSANSYMENVTSFSAGLISSLGGDTDKAANIANMAMIDMADNANKMGTSMESIQNAYQGFSRGNYTMLDNLKLGFAGTKSEMERLLAKAQEISGVHYDISNLSDVYEAIHVVQEEFKITGTTANEASTTLSGSLASMKASFTDLLGNIAMGQNLEASFSALIETTKTFVFSNFLPMLQNIFASVFNLVCEGLNNLAPGLGDGIKLAFENMQTTISIAWQAIETIFQSGIVQTVLTAIGDIIASIVQAVSDIASSPFIQTGIQLLGDALNGMCTTLSDVVKWFTDLNDKFNILTPVITALIGGFVGLKAALAISSTVTTLASAFKNFKGTLGTVKTAVSGLFTLISAHPFVAIGVAVGALVALVITHWAEIKKVIENVWNKIKETFENIGKAIADAWNTVKTKTEEVWNGLCTFIKGIIDDITGFFTGLVDGMFDIGKNILEGLWKGIKSAADWVTKKVKGVVDGIVGGIKGFLGIHSPSTVFAGIGENTMLGLAMGVEKNISPVERAMRSVEDAMGNNFTKKITFASSNLGSYDFSGDKANEAKPMMLNLTLAGKNFKAFVDDVSKVQDQKINLELAY